MRVIDGDTISVRGNNFRLRGFNTPETYRARCERERVLGESAKSRLGDLLRQARSAVLVPVDCNGTAEQIPTVDRYGRFCARLMLDLRDVADIMVSEGLAEPYFCEPGGHCRKPKDWCNER